MMATPRKLYDMSEIFDSGTALVDEKTNTQIYYEQRGNPNGPAIAIVHGGPGTGMRLEMSQYCDPSYYRIILFDQRGTGRSIPSIVEKHVRSDSFKDLTIEDMVADMEKLRKHLDVRAWLLLGGSWGSTLALNYTETHPESVSGLVVYGIFLNCVDEMLDYYRMDNIKKRFPVLGEAALSILMDYAKSKSSEFNSDNVQEFIQIYYKLCVLDDDPIAQYLWIAYENFNDTPDVESLRALNVRPSKDEIDPVMRAKAVFETTLFKYAFEGFDILNKTLLSRLATTKICIRQGLDDTEAPPIYANKLDIALRQFIPQLDFELVVGKHGADSSEEMTNEILNCIDSFKVERLRKVGRLSFLTEFNPAKVASQIDAQVTTSTASLKPYL